MQSTRRIAIRWNLTDTRPRAIEALRLSIAGATNLFGREARYVVAVARDQFAHARLALGHVASAVHWIEAQPPPSWLRARCGADVAWPVAPFRIFPDDFELVLASDCVLWARPAAIRAFLSDADRCLLAETVAADYGAFASRAGDEACASSIVGMSPGFDLEAAVARLLEETGARITSEADALGLLVASMRSRGAPYLVSLDELTPSSPYPPMRPQIGSCGAHFVGIARASSSEAEDDSIAQHWDRHRAAVHGRVASPIEGRKDSRTFLRVGLRRVG